MNIKSQKYFYAGGWLNYGINDKVTIGTNTAVDCSLILPVESMPRIINLYTKINLIPESLRMPAISVGGGIYYDTSSQLMNLLSIRKLTDFSLYVTMQIKPQSWVYLVPKTYCQPNYPIHWTIGYITQLKEKSRLMLEAIHYQDPMAIVAIEYKGQHYNTRYGIAFSNTIILPYFLVNFTRNL